MTPQERTKGLSSMLREVKAALPRWKVSLVETRAGPWLAHLQSPDVKSPGGWRDGPKIEGLGSTAEDALADALTAPAFDRHRRAA